jgi:hypothetical protein
MKQFFKFVLKLIVLTISLSTIVYIGLIFFFHEYHKRGKTDKRGLKVDVVFFGSSRCFNTIIPSRFDSIVGLKSYNMGVVAVQPREIYAMVNLYILNNYVPKYAFIQVDLKHDLVKVSELSKQHFLKYYFSQEIPANYYDDYTAHQMWIPLLPNALNREFGWREIIKSIFRNLPISEEMGGYFPISGVLQFDKEVEFIEVPDSFGMSPNTWIQQSIELLEKKGVKVILFTAPYYTLQPTDKLERLGLYELPYINCSKCISNSEMFSDVSHINHKGALVFTDSIAHRFLEMIR